MPVSNRVGDDLLYEALVQNEAYTHEAANAIDAKASQVFAAAAFLAVQPAVILIQPNVWMRVIVAQFSSCIALIIAVVYAHLVLRVMIYKAPGFDEEWRAKEIINAGPAATDDDVKATILWALIEQTRRRITDGDQRNDSKLKQLSIARVATIVALALNVISVVLYLFTAHAS